MARAASARATAGITHFSFTMRLKNPVNFETWSFDTTVRPSLSPWLSTALSGLNSVMPREFALSMMLLSAGVRLTTIPPAFSNFF